MATFEPNVQEGQDLMPSFLKGYSEPITQPRSVEANKSTAIALNTAANVIPEIADFTKITAHDIIEKDVRNTVEPIRTGFTNDLKGALGMDKNLILQASDTPSTPTPPAIDAGIANVNSIQSAMSNGKINSTYYHQRLDTAVTQLRSKYPGFTDYIDQRVSAITGVNPANALVNDLIQDVNSAVSNKKTNEDKELDMIRSKGLQYDKGQAIYERLKADPSFGPKALQWLNDEQAKDTLMERSKKAIELQNLDTGTKEKSYQKLYSTWVADKIDSDLNATITLNGMDKPEKILDVMRKASENPNYYSAAQMEEFATKLQSHGSLMRAQLGLLSDQEGWTNKVGGVSQRDAALDSTAKRFYDGLYEAVRGGGSGGAGLAFYMQNQARGIMDKTKLNLTSGKLGDLNNTFEILSQKLGPTVTANVLVPNFLKEAAKIPDPEGNLRGLLGEKQREAIAQPGGDDKPTTLQGHITKIANDDRIDQASKGFVYRGMVNTVNLLKDKDLPDEGKAAAVRYLFDPANNGVLSNWKMDYKTKSPDGRMQIVHPGKYQVWTDLTQKEVTDNIAKLDEKSKSYYKSWVDITGRELIGTDVRTLNHFTGHDDVEFKWSNEDGVPHLTRTSGGTSPVGQEAKPYAEGFKRPPEKGYLMQIDAVVDRINKALPNLEHAYKAFGGNTEAMILQTLQQYGMNFEGNVTGLPKAFGDAVAASRKKPEKERIPSDQ